MFMNFYINSIWAVSLMFLSGCSGMWVSHSKDMYKKGYQEGVHEQVKQVAGEFQGGNFPYYHWVAPIVQEVRVPAHLSNSAMIPEHTELVIIQPGQWTMNQGYPIESQKRKNYENQASNSINDNSNITALPMRVGYTKGSNE